MEEYTIVCLFVDESKDLFGKHFQIKAPPSCTISSLKFAILDQNKIIQTFFPKSYVNLWMFTPPLDISDSDIPQKCAAIDLPPQGVYTPGLPVCDEIRFLDPVHSLEYYWLNAHQLPKGFIHVLVQLIGDTRKSQLERLNDGQAMSEKIKSLSLQILDAPSPFETVCSQESVSQVYKESSGYVLRGRPAHNLGPSTSLFNSSLARLKDRIDSLHEITPSPDILRFASDFIIFMTAIDTSYRPSSLISILSEIFPIPQRWYSSEFTCEVEYNGQEVGYVFGVFKEEKGLDGDATLQAACQYSESIAELRLEDPSHRSNYPAILIGVMGTLLEISAVISLDGTCLDRLLVTDLLQRDDEASILQLGRIFSVLSDATADLRGYYSGHSESLSPQNSLAHFYPRPTSRRSDEYFPELVFWSKIDHDGRFVGAHEDVHYLQKQMTIYLATLKNPQLPELLSIADPSSGVDVVVKFTKSYNETAHRILADEGLAPPLYYCSQIAGGLYMVLMKMISGTSFSALKRVQSMPMKVYENVERAAHLLHQANLVHGDFRPTNFLITSRESTGNFVMVIDFDWAGIAGKDRYPPSLNDRYGSSSEERWAPGVGRYAVMMPEHDNWQLQRFKNSCRWQP